MTRKIWLGLALLSCGFGAFAADEETNFPHHELVAGSAGIVGIASNTTAGQITLNAGTSVSIAAAYNYALSRYIQLGINASLYFLKDGNSSGTFFQGIGGPTFNLPLGRQGIYDSLFLSAMGGVLTGGGTTTASFDVELGVRVRMMEHVAYRPSAGVFLETTGSITILVFRPVNFAILF